jgi:hypothetical protein
VDFGNGITDDFPQTRRTTQFPPIVAILERLVTPETDANSARVAGFFLGL